MAKVKIKEMSVDDLEHFIEEKLLEIIGDPDSGLQIKEKFRKKIDKILRKVCKQYMIDWLCSLKFSMKKNNSLVSGYYAYYSSYWYYWLYKYKLCNINAWISNKNIIICSLISIMILKLIKK